jgi:hypothetical protein
MDDGKRNIDVLALNCTLPAVNKSNLEYITLNQGKIGSKLLPLVSNTLNQMVNLTCSPKT